MTRRLIITADDYGMCASVNDAIEACLSAGTVRATCAMVNMPLFNATASLRQKFPDCSVGIHWTLTQGKPVLPPARLPTLVGPDGEFHPVLEFRRRWVRGRINADEIRSELRAQCQQFSQVASVPDFWNTHQNSHVLPRLFDLFVLVGRELGIPAMRCHRRLTVPYNMSPLRHNLSNPLYWFKGRVIARWAAKAEARGALMPDGRVYTPGYDGGGIASLPEIVDRIEWSAVRRAVELVVHPATAVEERLFGSMTQSRLLEYKVLREPALKERLRQSDVELASFEALRPSQ
jgi:predicted glycoside hydrolase/deacetylase ChbG (UPF0249 family)